LTHSARRWDYGTQTQGSVCLLSRVKKHVDMSPSFPFTPVWLIVPVAAIGLAVVLQTVIWLLIRHRFHNRSFLTLFRYEGHYVRRKWRQKPDRWSILRYIQRSCGEVKRRVVLDAQVRKRGQIAASRLRALARVLGCSFPPQVSALILDRDLLSRGAVVVRTGPTECDSNLVAADDPVVRVLPVECVVANGLDREVVGQSGGMPQPSLLWIDDLPRGWVPAAQETLRNVDCVILHGGREAGRREEREEGGVAESLAQFGLGLWRPAECEMAEEFHVFFRNDLVTMSTLGAHGQFGNQVLQYAMAAVHARRKGARLQVRPWDGQMVFARRDPIPERRLSTLWEKPGSMFGPDELPERVNVDFIPSIARRTNSIRAEAGYIRNLFKVKQSVEERLQSGLQRLRSEGRTIVALHLRHSRWDCGHGVFFIAPCEWYTRWLDQIWPDLNRPVLFVATDVPENVVPRFARFNPYTARRLGLSVRELSLFPDFYVLTQADRLAISNSSFSFAASMLNTRARVFMRPDREEMRLVPYDPWDGEPLLNQTGGEEPSPVF